ncbi:hypothetical protein [Amycolatopsis sacchari]|uniref:Uncharacterized protein n=1 Tax=Amycolatopsis sacchari TaxID=115433 RepID=A0A1I3SLN9_9PSEU|nr:hypothetical protein SAMN05421835_106346 [Amycolatopsis sacchari]
MQVVVVGSVLGAAGGGAGGWAVLVTGGGVRIEVTVGAGEFGRRHGGPHSPVPACLAAVSASARRGSPAASGSGEYFA